MVNLCFNILGFFAPKDYWSLEVKQQTILLLTVHICVQNITKSDFWPGLGKKKKENLNFPWLSDQLLQHFLSIVWLTP